MNYPVLALDVATNSASACLLLDENTSFTACSTSGQQHSQTILPLLQEVLLQSNLDWHDLKLLALGQGPGSFTGLRIAAAMFAGINASMKLPIWGISSLAITAMQTASEEAVWVLEDARAGEAFVGCYQQGKCLQKDSCITWQEVSHLPAAHYVSQQAIPIELTDWQKLELCHSRADAMILYMQQMWANIDQTTLSPYIQPVYLQLSQAEKNLKHG